MSTGQPQAYALLSVTDKAGIADLAKSLVKLGYGILSTGGTAKAIREAGVHVMDVAEFTGSPEFFDGRVKTLHPKVHGGILMDRSNPKHQEQAQELNIRGIDLVVVNFYQFAKEAKDKDMELAKAIEYIDIGGPTMLRAAAKNYENTAAVIDPSDYDLIIEDLDLACDLRSASNVSNSISSACAGC